jgi:hypothetical protein
MFTLDPAKSWTQFEKIIFRLLFLCLGFFLLDYEIGILLIDLDQFKALGKMYAHLSQPLLWMDQHLFHVGYNPKLHQSFPGDSYFGMVYYLTIISISILIVIIWSIIERHKKDYHQLNYWFRLYVRYVVALIVFSYGIQKVFPVQMGYPRVTDLLTPMGDEVRFNVAWNFIGASPGYETFTGMCEVVGSLLLLFNRTYVFGSLFMCTVLTNVVALNVFYNIGVILPSTFLLVSVWYLFLPYAEKLTRFFFGGKTISISEKQYKLEKSWKKYLVFGLLILIPFLSIVNSTYEANKLYRKVQAGAKDAKLYDVTFFVMKDTLQPLLTDTLQWRRFVFLSKKNIAIYNMQDKADFYDCDIDSLKKTCRLHDNDDSTKWDVMHYSYPGKMMLRFTGSWKGASVNILMKEIPIDSMKLNKEKYTFLQG